MRVQASSTIVDATQLWPASQGMAPIAHSRAWSVCSRSRRAAHLEPLSPAPFQSPGDAAAPGWTNSFPADSGCLYHRCGSLCLSSVARWCQMTERLRCTQGQDFDQSARRPQLVEMCRHVQHVMLFGEHAGSGVHALPRQASTVAKRSLWTGPGR